jgi:IS1 family transposase
VVIDGLWTFVARKKDDFRVWLALSRRNLQVIAFFVGATSRAEVTHR